VEAGHTVFVFAQKLRADVAIGAYRRPVRSIGLTIFVCATSPATRSSMTHFLLPTAFSKRVFASIRAEAMSAWFTQRGKGQGLPVRIEIRSA
jgi:hypothetical protein